MIRAVLLWALLLPCVATQAATNAGAPARERGLTANTVGFTQMTAPYVADPGGTPLMIGVWYPTAGIPQNTTLGPMRQTVAVDALPLPGRHALVLLSHGSGGWLGSHIDTATALATAGFVVAAPTHAGDDFRDRTRSTDPGFRAGQARTALDAVLERWSGRTTIDPARIGMFGFSSGALTTLLLAGAVPDLSRVAPFCADHPDNYACRLRREHPSTTHAPLDGLADHRIRATAIAAPPLGASFSSATTMANVHVPVLLWRGNADDVVKLPDGIDPIATALLREQVALQRVTVPGATHWDFLAPCTPDLMRLAPSICAERDGFDRAAFHRTFNRALVDFFRKTLDTTGP